MSDRKYRHRGYQDRDEDRRERRPRRSSDGRMGEGPRGRSAGLPTEVAFKCAECGRKVEILGRVEPDATCPGCEKPLHTCTNCAHFDTSAPLECRKPIPARIESKTKANRCELFSPKAIRDLSSRGPSTPKEGRQAFEDLFK